MGVGDGIGMGAFAAMSGIGLGAATPAEAVGAEVGGGVPRVLVVSSLVK